jgi:hypothetical protein
MTDPVLTALDRMRPLQDEELKAAGAARDASVRLRAAEIEALKTPPTSAAGALALLYFVSVEVESVDADPQLLAETIRTCCKVLENLELLA